MEPAFDAFEAAYARGENQLVWARLAADLDTPVSLMLKLAIWPAIHANRTIHALRRLELQLALRRQDRG